jgi:hypothetical protein
MTASSTIDLLKLFQTAGKTVGKNRESLNQADEYNHDHGDNMVQIFNVITEAVKAKKKSEPSAQLAYAAELLQQRSKSGSAQFYSQSLANAASKFQGKQVTGDNVVQLIQTLLGGGQAAQTNQQPAASAANTGIDLLGSLLGGGQSTSGQQPAASTEGDAFGSLLGGLLGGSSQQGSDGLDAADLLNAGMAFMQAKQQGKDTGEALISAVLSGSQLNDSSYHSQSGQLVANALLQAVAAMAKK